MSEVYEIDMPQQLRDLFSREPELLDLLLVADDEQTELVPFLCANPEIARAAAVINPRYIESAMAAGTALGRLYLQRMWSTVGRRDRYAAPDLA